MRMGQDKALLPWADATLLEHQLAKLRATGASEVFVSARNAEKYRWAGAPIICDDCDPSGPLGGISSVLRHVRTPFLLALGIDMPAMTAAFLCGLIGKTEPTRGVIVERDGWFEPLAAVYPCESLPIAEAQIARRKFAMQAFIHELIVANLMKVLPLRPADFSLFTNLNQPSEFDRSVAEQ